MAVEFICDNCGKREKARFNWQGSALKPSEWFERGTDEDVQHACSRKCVDELIESKYKQTGKRDMVAPL